MKNIKKVKSDRILMWIMFVVFIIYSITLLFPFLWLLMNSFKTRQDFFLNVNGLPKQWIFDNWLKSFSLSVDKVSIPMMYVNSFIFTIGSTFLSIMSCSATAYVITKYEFRGRMFIYSLAIVIMMVPTLGSMSATYRLYNNLGLINTYSGVLLFSLGGFGTSFLLLYGFYKNISWTYAEAAQIDGAGHFLIYFKIMLPMAIPTLTAVAILQAIGYWNDYFTIYMYAPAKATIAYGMQRISAENKSNLPLIFASMIFSMIPIIVVFICFQKTIMSNTTVGGIKG